MLILIVRSNFSKTSVLDCRCGSSHCRGKLERRDAKREKERQKSTLAAAVKRKAASLFDASASALSISDDPASASASASAAAAEAANKRQRLGEKRKTFRARGWVYLDPKMELKRMQEDALERGRPVDGLSLIHISEPTRPY